MIFSHCCILLILTFENGKSIRIINIMMILHFQYCNHHVCAIHAIIDMIAQTGNTGKDRRTRRFLFIPPPQSLFTRGIIISAVCIITGISIWLKSDLRSSPTNLMLPHKRSLCSDIEFVGADHRSDFNQIDNYICLN